MEEKEKNQKTVVAFIAGLLIGGLLVWVFSVAPSAKKDVVLDDTNNTTDTTPTASTTGDVSVTPTKDNKVTTASMPTPAAVHGAGSITVDDQPAGTVVKLGEMKVPLDSGWVVVHETNADGSLGNALGASRFGVKEGLMPTQVELLRATMSGKTYAVVFYNENGDKIFSKSSDAPVTTDSGARIEDSFTAK